MAAHQQPFDDVLRRVQGEYIEMPGLRLTTAQAQRLWGLDRTACDTLLGALVDAKFLFRTRDGAFVRSDQVGPPDRRKSPARLVGVSPSLRAVRPTRPQRPATLHPGGQTGPPPAANSGEGTENSTSFSVSYNLPNPVSFSGLCFMQPAQPLGEPTEGVAAMRHLELVVLTDFGHRLPVGRVIENRVVAKARRSPSAPVAISP